MPVWQHNYYEHVIRSEDELNRVREYVVSNPSSWADDTENPSSNAFMKRSTTIMEAHR